MNLHIISGYLGQDPETIASGKGIELRIATEHWAGEAKGRVTTWHKVVVWGEAAATRHANYLRKGDYVTIHGRVDRRRYETKGGDAAVATSTVADVVEYGPRQRGAKERQRERSAHTHAKASESGGHRDDFDQSEGWGQ